MNVTLTPATGSTVVLEVEVPAGQLQRSIDESVRHLAQRTRVPGFRPGKVPRPMLERALGVRRDDPEAPNAIYDDAKEHLFESSILEALRDQHATLVPVEERAAQADDYAVIGFEGRRDGEPFEGGSAERFPLVIGAERMVPGFEAELVGLAEGESKTFSLTFPDDYPDQALAGQPVEFSVTMRELRAKQLPPLDDEFAGQLGPYPDLDALRTDIRARLEASARDRARHAFADRIIEFAVANATLELPDLLIEREVEVMHDELRVRLAEQGIGYEEYLKVTGRDDAALHAEYREPAEHRVKVLLVLSAIADQEGIEVEDAEIEAEIARARERYAKQPKLLAYFDSARGRSYLRSTMRRTKVVEELVDRWLAAHPEAGPLPHLEEEPTTADPLAAAQEASAEQGSPA